MIPVLRSTVYTRMITVSLPMFLPHLGIIYNEQPSLFMYPAVCVGSINGVVLMGDDGYVDDKPLETITT